jgi:Tfp pilus assembly protein PilF
MLSRSKLAALGALLCAIVLILGGTLAGEDRTYEVSGRVRLGGKSPGRLPVMVFLDGAVTPFAASALTDPSGKFKFKRLLPGMYRLTVVVAGWGRSEETIDVGPSTADRGGRVVRDVEFRKEAGWDGGATVSPAELALPADAVKAYQKAESALGRRDVEKAIEELEKAVALAPDYSDAWNRLGTIAYQTRRYEEAERYFTEALRCDPRSYAATVNLGAAQLVLGKLDLALETNRAAVKERPDDPLAHSQLGQVYFALNRLDQARDSLQMAKSLDPGHFSWPQLVLAEIYRQWGDHEAVARELREFLRYHPDASAAPKLRELLAELESRGY